MISYQPNILISDSWLCRWPKCLRCWWGRLLRIFFFCILICINPWTLHKTMLFSFFFFYTHTVLHIHTCGLLRITTLWSVERCVACERESSLWSCRSHASDLPHSWHWLSQTSATAAFLQTSGCWSTAGKKHSVRKRLPRHCLKSGHLKQRIVGVLKTRQCHYIQWNSDR